LKISNMRNSIYIIQQGMTRLFKIGVSKNPEVRLRNLQTGNPHTLHLLKTFPCRVPAYKAERIIHNHLSHVHVRGEWFQIPTDDAVVNLARVLIKSL